MYGGPGSLVFRDRKPEDIAQEAMWLFLKGDRKWDPKRVPDLLYFLRGVVNSIINHQSKYVYVRKTVSLNQTAEHEEDMDTSREDPLETIQSDAQRDSVIEGFIAQDGKKDAERLLILIKEEIGNDEELALLFLCLEEGITKPREISNETDIPAERISELKRKLEQKALRALRRIKPEVVKSLMKGEQHAG